MREMSSHKRFVSSLGEENKKNYSRFLSRARKKDDLSDPEGALGEGQFGHMQFLA